MVKLFITGATGYIGGDFLYTISQAHSEYAVSVLVRREETISRIRKSYPSVEIVEGDLDDGERLAAAAAEADVVLNLAATNHLAGFKALHSGASKRKLAHFIQISGATMVSQDEIKSGNFGDASPHQYDDLSDQEELRQIIRKHENRLVDNQFLDFAERSSSVKSALVIPSLIYGRGRGPINQRSIQVPELARIALEKKHAVQIGAGENIWSNIHISDLSSMLLKLVENAVSQATDDQAWGPNGMFFARSNPGISFGQIARLISDAAQKEGLFSDSQIEKITAAEADGLSPHASAIVGTNARTLSKKAQQVLGWSASGSGLEDEVSATVVEEARRLQTRS
ncbi:hypothetical protein CB0940_09958 [Cercospora beticola]|uniref:NAD(P)-binding domain-containing protein n=1 Tax=Cercospora beticola TaxID=122368 RepID=A0A2G5HHD2_CERBT|nr:hypothetical protein CB0940_09958 [Cercospora beticola]PIA91951.1 hypothetical protein CB0940_09958 [Cercospora beticola]WPB05691.1 hypothetical protein RHO25_010345 [Cercospora beticola]